MRPGARPPRCLRLLLAALLAGTSAAPAAAQTLADLLDGPRLTPRGFAALFEGFEYEFGPEVQPPDRFMAARRGDCDDYAVLADHVLRHHGYGTRLVHVRLVGRVAHAVCYVTEERAYLDYNNRRFFITLERSGPTLREIAEKVSRAFEGNWTSASEFTYDYATNEKALVRTVVKTNPPALDPDAAAGKAAR